MIPVTSSAGGPVGRGLPAVQARILWLSFLASLVVRVVVGYFLAPQVEGRTPPEPIVQVPGLVALRTGVAAVALPRLPQAERLEGLEGLQGRSDRSCQSSGGPSRKARPSSASSFA